MYRTNSYNLYRRRTEPVKPSYEIGGIVKEVREDYPPEVADFMKKHGDEVITSIKVGREPVNKNVVNVLNAISLGTLKKAINKVGIDTLFHLYLIINDKYRFEKNQVIDFSTKMPASNAQVIPINFGKKDLTIKEFVDNAIKYMGKTDFYTYGAFGNRNCQGFVSGLLRGSGIMVPDKFVNQGADQIANSLPGYVPKVANAITDVAGALDLIKQKIAKLLPFEQGGVVQSVILPKSDFTEDQAIEWIKKHDYKYKKIDAPAEFYRFRQINPKKLKGKKFRNIKLPNGVELIMAYNTGGVVSMPVKDYLNEHRDLIAVLNRGNPLELKKEAIAQTKEVLGRGLKL
jgi:hypothetical protein